MNELLAARDYTALPTASNESRFGPRECKQAKPRRRKKDPQGSTPKAKQPSPKSPHKNTTEAASVTSLALVDGQCLTDICHRPAKLGQQVALLLHRAWQWLQLRRCRQLASRRLRLCETVSLGEKRFVAIVRVDDQHFLLGGGPGGVAMLSALSSRDGFASLMQGHGKRSSGGA